MKGEWQQSLHAWVMRLLTVLRMQQHGTCRPVSFKSLSLLQGWMLLIFCKTLAMLPELSHSSIVTMSRHGFRKLQGQSAQTRARQTHPHTDTLPLDSLSCLSRTCAGKSMQDLVREKNRHLHRRWLHGSMLLRARQQLLRHL